MNVVGLQQPECPVVVDSLDGDCRECASRPVAEDDRRAPLVVDETNLVLPDHVAFSCDGESSIAGIADEDGMLVKFLDRHRPVGLVEIL